MASEIKVDTIVNAGGDNDSGIDLATNDNIKFNIAGSQKAIIESNGRLGVGISSPSQPLVVSNGTEQHQVGFASGEVYLMARNASAYITQEYIANQHTFTGYGDSSSNESMRIDSSGNLLIGTTNSSLANEGVRFLRAGSAGAMHAEFFNDSGGIAATIGRGGSDGMCLQFKRGSTERGGVSVDGSGTTYATSSDYRLKENVVTDWDATTRLKQLKPSRFNFKESKDTTLDGFLAHEVTSVVPEATTGTKDEVDKDGNPVYQGIDQSKLVPLLTKALQEAISEIDTLKEKVKALESK